MDGFWEAVSTNLAVKRLRLLFVADFIPDPLARIVAFLNAQMPDIEVLAVEIKRFHGKSAQTLVPRVIGRTAAAAARGRGRSGQRLRLTRESFLDGFEDDDVRGVAERLMDAASQPGGDIYYGDSGVTIRAKCSAWPRPITVAWVYPQPGKKWMNSEECSFGTAVLDDALPEDLRAMLERWVDEVSADSFADVVSSDAVKAWVVRYRVGVQHQDVLVERLRRIISELASL